MGKHVANSSPCFSLFHLGWPGPICGIFNSNFVHLEFRFLHLQIHKLLTALLMTFFYLCIPKFVAVDPMHRMDMPVCVHYISVNTIMLKTRVPSPHRIVLIFCNKLDVMRSGDTIVTWR